jgi:hypothetical protein
VKQVIGRSDFGVDIEGSFAFSGLGKNASVSSLLCDTIEYLRASEGIENLMNMMKFSSQLNFLYKS